MGVRKIAHILFTDKEESALLLSGYDLYEDEDGKQYAIFSFKATEKVEDISYKVLLAFCNEKKEVLAKKTLVLKNLSLTDNQTITLNKPILLPMGFEGVSVSISRFEETSSSIAKKKKAKKEKPKVIKEKKIQQKEKKDDTQKALKNKPMPSLSVSGKNVNRIPFAVLLPALLALPLSLLPLTTSFSVQGFIFGQSFETEDFLCKRTGNGTTCEITSYIGDDNSVNIPSVIQGCIVKSIGEYAFQGSSVTDVSVNARNLSIGDYAFLNCLDLQSFDFEMVSSIGNNAFENCSALISVKATNLTSVGDEAFKNATALREIAIGKKDTSVMLGDKIFSGCSLIDSFYLYGDIASDFDYTSFFTTENTFIHDLYFENYDATVPLAEFAHTENFFYILTVSIDTLNKTMVQDFARGLTTLDAFVVSSYPDGTIPSYAFHNCTALTSFRISSSKGLVILDYAFGNCTNLVDFLFSDVISIGYRSFTNCLAFETITLSSRLQYVDSDAFKNCTNLRKVFFGNSAALPEDSTATNTYATFYYNNNVCDTRSYKLVNGTKNMDMMVKEVEYSTSSLIQSVQGKNVLDNATCSFDYQAKLIGDINQIKYVNGNLSYQIEGSDFSLVKKGTNYSLTFTSNSSEVYLGFFLTFGRLADFTTNYQIVVNKNGENLYLENTKSGSDYFFQTLFINAGDTFSLEIKASSSTTMNPKIVAISGVV